MSYRMHPREQKVNSAKHDLLEAWMKAYEKYELTTGEMLRVLTEFNSDQVGSIAKYAIREERHGRTDKPGGIE